jgi:hypothetical protein
MINKDLQKNKYKIRRKAGPTEIVAPVSATTASNSAKEKKKKQPPAAATEAVAEIASTSASTLAKENNKKQPPMDTETKAVAETTLAKDNEAVG